MCNANNYFIFLAVCFGYLYVLKAEEWHSQFINCTELKECPDNSICTKVEAHLKCVCWQGYYQHPEWKSDIIMNGNETDYCARGAANKTVIYRRLPGKRENLAVAILIILFAVILVTVFLYCLVVIRPINVTKSVYYRIRMRRKNHRRLIEFDGVDLNFQDSQRMENVS